MIITPTAFFAPVGGDEPQPITTDLTFWLDSDKSTSYPGTGNTWFDISPSGPTRNFTLYNSPTYTSGPGGYFTFDGSTQYGSYNPGTGNYEWWDQSADESFTFEFVLNINSFATDQSFFSQWGATVGEQTYDWLTTSAGGNSIYVLTRDNANLPALGTFSTSTWYHVFIELEFDSGTGDYIKRVYVNNGSPDSGTWSNYVGWEISQYDTHIARRQAGLYWGGKMGVIRFYPRLLTSEEKTHNYNLENAKYSF